jgi:ribonuclease HI
MAAENRTSTKNFKTNTIRKMLDHEGPRITLLWVPSHVGIPGNEKADQAAKQTLDEDISTTERNPPDDLKKWLTGEDFKRETKDGKTETTR